MDITTNLKLAEVITYTPPNMCKVKFQFDDSEYTVWISEEYANDVMPGQTVAVKIKNGYPTFIRYIKNQ